MSDDLTAMTGASGALVLVLSAGGSLCAWEREGSLEREWALYERLGGTYERIIVVSDAGADQAEREREIAATLRVALVMNEDGTERAAHLARLGEMVRGALGDAPRSVVVKTNQHSAADPALAIVSGLERSGVDAALVARGGYLWTRFVAHELGAGSREFAECASRERELVRRADVVVGTSRSMLGRSAGSAGRVSVDAVRRARAWGRVAGVRGVRKPREGAGEACGRGGGDVAFDA